MNDVGRRPSDPCGSTPPPRVGQLGRDEATTREVAGYEFMDLPDLPPHAVLIDGDTAHIVTDDPTGSYHAQTQEARISNIEVALCRQDVERWAHEDGERR